MAGREGSAARAHRNLGHTKASACSLTFRKADRKYQLGLMEEIDGCLMISRQGRDIFSKARQALRKSFEFQTLEQKKTLYTKVKKVAADSKNKKESKKEYAPIESYIKD